MILFTIADVIINLPPMCAKSYPQRFTQAVIISWKHLEPIYWKNLLAVIHAFSSNKNMYSMVNIWSVPMTKCSDKDLHWVLRCHTAALYITVHYSVCVTNKVVS